MEGLKLPQVETLYIRRGAPVKVMKKKIETTIMHPSASLKVRVKKKKRFAPNPILTTI